MHKHNNTWSCRHSLTIRCSSTITLPFPFRGGRLDLPKAVVNERRRCPEYRGRATSCPDRPSLYRSFTCLDRTTSIKPSACSERYSFKMSYKPLPSKRGLPGGAIKLAAETSSIADSTTSKQEEDIGRRIWTETQWVNLTKQAIDLGLPKLPYFDPQTMLLSKEVNKNLWRQLVSTCNH